MKQLEVFIPCIPPTATSQMKGVSHRGGRTHFYKRASVASAERMLLVLIRNAMPRDWQMIEQGPVQLVVGFVWPWRKGEPVRERQFGFKHKHTKPDCSNIVKMLEDALTTLEVWKDDAQVADLRVIKGWSDTPGINISVSQIKQQEG